MTGLTGLTATVQLLPWIGGFRAGIYANGIRGDNWGWTVPLIGLEAGCNRSHRYFSLRVSLAGFWIEAGSEERIHIAPARNEMRLIAVARWGSCWTPHKPRERILYSRLLRVLWARSGAAA